jgi:hypothetical protein
MTTPRRWRRPPPASGAPGGTASDSSAMAETWRERVSRARESGEFAREDWGRAARWSTCAVAEQARRNPEAVQTKNGCPVDEELGRLGTAFFAAVVARDVARAESTLTRIEDRVLELERDREAARLPAARLA